MNRMPPADLPDSALATALNRDCQCVRADVPGVTRALAPELTLAGYPSPITESHPHLLASTPVFLSASERRQMQDVIGAVETVVASDGYRHQVLGGAPAIAREDRGPRGAFIGYDFHLTPEGPRLIEINSNAGGALLNLQLARSLAWACPEEAAAALPLAWDVAGLEDELAAMLRAEWALARSHLAAGVGGAAELRRIAIVDRDPASQFLHPELLLFQRILGERGLAVVIADPRALAVREGALFHGDHAQQLVYNRLTDFHLEASESASIRQAYSEGLAAVTPNPHNYALYADKGNLPLLSDPSRLAGFGLDRDVIRTLTAAIPPALPVTTENADRLWNERRRYFFKPRRGYGSLGAFRGSKLTRRTWQSILAADYVAQAFVAPSTRNVLVDGELRALKVDIRCYTYGGRIQQITGRLYAGQTTNMRTAGGGLTPVLLTG